MIILSTVIQDAIKYNNHEILEFFSDIDYAAFNYCINHIINKDSQWYITRYRKLLTCEHVQKIELSIPNPPSSMMGNIRIMILDNFKINKIQINMIEEFIKIVDGNLRELCGDNQNLVALMYEYLFDDHIQEQIQYIVNC